MNAFATYATHFVVCCAHETSFRKYTSAPVGRSFYAKVFNVKLVRYAPSAIFYVKLGRCRSLGDLFKCKTRSLRALGKPGGRTKRLCDRRSLCLLNAIYIQKILYKNYYVRPGSTLRGRYKLALPRKPIL